MFTNTLTNVAMMVVFMALGYILCLSGKGSASHTKTVSAILVYILNPLMIVNSFLKTEYTAETAKSIGIFFVVTLILQALFFVALYLVVRKKTEDPRFRIFCVASVLGNVGFLGMPIVYGIFPNSPIVTCYSSAYVVSMNIIVFTLGVFMITKDKKFISIKSAIINPTSLALIVALPLFFFSVTFPPIIADTVNVLAKAVTPVCMIIIGMRLSAMNKKALFTNPIVYLTAAVKLLVFPTFVFICVYFLPFFDNTLKISLIVLACMPSGAIISTLSELYGKERELSAQTVLLVTVLSVATIPLVTLIVTSVIPVI